jgi:hypothetical protein
MSDIMEIKHLNVFSQRVYDFLKSNRPSYIEHASASPCTNFGGDFINFAIEPPNKNASYLLTFDTKNNKVTICFDKCHCHYHNFAELDFDMETKRSIDTVEKIMTDQLLSFSYYHDDRLIMGGFNDRTYLTNLRNDSPELLEKNINRIVVISWTGTLDDEKKIQKITTANSTFQKAWRSWWQKLFSSE